jgi:hypothetical protein
MMSMKGKSSSIIIVTFIFYYIFYYNTKDKGKGSTKKSENNISRQVFQPLTITSTRFALVRAEHESLSS